MNFTSNIVFKYIYYLTNALSMMDLLLLFESEAKKIRLCCIIKVIQLVNFILFLTIKPSLVHLVILY